VIDCDKQILDIICTHAPASICTSTHMYARTYINTHYTCAFERVYVYSNETIRELSAKQIILSFRLQNIKFLNIYVTINWEKSKHCVIKVSLANNIAHISTTLIISDDQLHVLYGGHWKYDPTIVQY